MRYVLLCIMALALTACSPNQVIVRVPQEVLVPVEVKCKVDMPVRPDDISKEPIPNGAYEKAARALKENTDLRAYSSQLEAALSACTAPK